MFLNALHIRLGLMVVGALLLGVFLAFGGRLGPRPVIQVEYGMYPEVFQGMTVEIDGQRAGTLHPFGAANRTGFVVKEGRHSVRVVHPAYASVARDVDVRADGRPVLLILDLQQNLDPRAASKTAIAWQN